MVFPSLHGYRARFKVQCCTPVAWQHPILFRTLVFNWVSWDECHNIKSQYLHYVFRYGHSMTRVGLHVFIFGGWDGTRSLPDLVTLDFPQPQHQEQESPAEGTAAGAAEIVTVLFNRDHFC